MEERTKHGWKGLLSNIDSRKKEKARLKQATKNNRNNRNLDDFLRAGGKLGGSGAFSSLFPHSGSVQQATAPLPPRKKPRREGLAVGFHEPPDIIGEGGDDCSVPVSELKTAQSEWEQQQIPPDEHTESDGPPQLPPNRASQFGFDTSWLPPLTTDSSFLQVLSSSDKRLSMREGNETSGLARRLITSMRAEEESVLKQSIQERLQAEESNDKPSDPTLNFGFDEETESSSSASSSLSSPPLPSESEFIPDSSNHRFAPAPPLEPMPEEESPSDWEPSAIPDRPVLQSSHLPDQTPEAPTPGSKSLPSAASQTPIEEPQLRHSTASSFRPFQDFEFGVAVSTDDNASKSIAPDTPGLVHMPTSAPPTRETVRNTSPVRRYHSARKSQQQKYLHSHSQSHSLPFHSVPPPQTPQSPAASPSASMGGLSAANSSSLSLTSPASRKLWPNAIKNATENAAADFLAIADSYDALFEHMFHDGNPEPKLTDCMRASAWWVIKGRGQLESALRARAQAGSSSVSSTTISAELQQGAVNISKARWLNNSMANVLHGRGEEMTEQRNGQRRPDVSHAMIKSLRPLHQTIKSLVQALAMSMNRNNIKLVPVSEADTSPGGIDATIWLKYPDDYDLGRDLTASLSSYVPRSLRVDQASKTSDVDLAELIPMSDSPRFFNYGRMFVTAVVRHEEGDEREQHQFIPCVLSITRDRTDWHVLAFIASQSSLVNIVIQFDPKQGLTWNEVTWDSRQFIASIDLRSPFGFKLDLHFGAAPGTPPDANSQGKADYTKFRDTVDYMFKTNEEVSPLEDETVVLETVLKNFQYVQKTGSRNMTTFPIEPSQRCRIRLFERRTLVKGSNRSKHKHLGFRMVLVTSPKVKTLSCLTYFFSHSSPIVYEYMHPPTPRSVGLNGFSSPPQQPDTVESRILVLHLSHQQTSTPFQARFAFNEQSELDNFRALLNSVKLSPGELESQKFKMHAYAVEEPNSSHAKHYNNNNSSSPHLTFSGPTKAVAASVHHSSPDSPELSVSVITKQSRIGHNETINSDSLRLHVRCPSGSITDRMNMSKFIFYQRLFWGNFIDHLLTNTLQSRAISGFPLILTTRQFFPSTVAASQTSQYV